jgi:hypothetical protein
VSKHGAALTILSSLPFLAVGVVVFAMGGPMIVGFVLLMWGLGGIIYAVFGMLGIGRRDQPSGGHER